MWGLRCPLSHQTCQFAWHQVIFFHVQRVRATLFFLNGLIMWSLLSNLERREEEEQSVSDSLEVLKKAHEIMCCSALVDLMNPLRYKSSCFGCYLMAGVASRQEITVNTAGRVLASLPNVYMVHLGSAWPAPPHPVVLHIFQCTQYSNVLYCVNYVSSIFIKVLQFQCQVSPVAVWWVERVEGVSIAQRWPAGLG